MIFLVSVLVSVGYTSGGAALPAPVCCLLSSAYAPILFGHGRRIRAGLKVFGLCTPLGFELDGAAANTRGQRRSHGS